MGGWERTRARVSLQKKILQSFAPRSREVEFWMSLSLPSTANGLETAAAFQRGTEKEG